MKKLLLFLFTLALGIGDLRAQTTGSIRLALVAPEASLRPALDLLTVELSRDDRISLLERTEIERIYREQAVSATGQDYLKLGRVLGADGLLVAETIKDGTSDQVAIRLLAVKPGVVLAILRSPWPVNELAEWVKGIPPHFAALMPKLTVLPKDAVPISVVNLRSAISSRETRELEQQLTLLTIERLTRERELFVLERRRMELLSEENELKPAEDSAFWNGSYLLDGVIDRDGYTKERVTLHARLAAPRGGASVQIEASEVRTNLSALVDQLVARILGAVQRRSDNSTWNPAAEAERYFREARWAYRWGMLAVAAANCEASWALGNRTSELAELRIRSYYDDGIDTALAWYDLANKFIVFSRGHRPTPGEIPTITAPPPGAGELPDHARFGRVRRAMGLYGAAFRQFVTEAPQPDWKWYDLGIDLLEGASYWLRHYYYMPEARTGHEPGIGEVRELARELASLLEHPAFTNAFGRNRYFSTKVNWGYPGTVRTQRTPGTLLETKVTWGAYWTDTPEEGVALYRSIIQQGLMPRVRRMFAVLDFTERSGGFGQGTLHSREVVNYLTGWKWSDRKRVRSVWHDFIAELTASTNLLTKAEGLYLRAAQAPGEAEHVRDFRELLEFLEQEQDALAASGFLAGMAADLDALVDSRGTARAESRATIDERERLVNRFQQMVGASIARATKAGPLAEMKAYLTAGAYDYIKFNALFRLFDYQAEDARALLPLVRSCRSNVTAQLELLSHQVNQLQGNLRSLQAEDRAKFNELLRQRASVSACCTDLDWLERTLDAKLNPIVSMTPTASPPAPTSTSLATTSSVSSMPTHSIGGTTPTRPGTGSPLTNALTVSQFWSLPERLPGTAEPSYLSIVNWVFREGRLWLDARAMRIGTYAGQGTYFNRAALFAVELESFQSQVIPLEAQSFKLSGNMFKVSPRTFEVHNGWLYVSSMDVIRRYSLNARIWEDLSLPIQGHARIVFVGDRLLVSTEDVILEASPDGKVVRILASGRREPPVTVLDSLANFSLAPVVEGPAESLITFIAGKMYEMPHDAKDWTLLPTPQGLLNADARHFDAGLVLFQSSRQNSEIFALIKGTRSLALVSVPSAPVAARLPAAFGGISTLSGNSLPPRRQWPVETGNAAFYLADDALWVLSGVPSVASALRAAPGKGELNATLSCSELQRTESVEIPLRLRLPQTVSTVGQLVGFPRGAPLLNATPAGLAVVIPGVQGFWLIPQSELAGRRAAAASAARLDPQPQGIR